VQPQLDLVPHHWGGRGGDPHQLGPELPDRPLLALVVPVPVLLWRVRASDA
jgi:hypothetical protein